MINGKKEAEVPLEGWFEGWFEAYPSGEGGSVRFPNLYFSCEMVISRPSLETWTTGYPIWRVQLSMNALISRAGRNSSRAV